ncbi:MAG: galactose ABC transporter substrate-binding protein [Clostridia bacterium]|nr:galactose ABC transporter substrate-binding protein [Clostridia bacterium]
MKKLTALVMALALCLGLAACSSGTPAATPTPAAPGTASTPAPAAAKKVGICIYKFDDNFMTVYRNNLETMLKEKGYEVTIVDGNNDQAKQTEQINTFITQGMDALIVNPVMTTAAAPMIELVKGAGIPTVIINREPEATDMALWDQVAYVGADASQSGTFQGQLILDTENKGDINGDGTVSYIMVQGDPENVDAKLRTEYSVKALTDAGVKVEQLDLQRGDWDQIRGQEITANDLSQYGDKVEVVFCNNDAMALGALEAIKAAGRTVGKDIYLVGVDALDDAVAKVAAGEMTGTVLNDAKGQATKAIEVMEALLGGKTVGNGLESQNYVDYVMVTQATAPEYMAK